MFKVTDEESNEIGKTAKWALTGHLRLDDRPFMAAPRALVVFLVLVPPHRGGLRNLGHARGLRMR
jgi:hypothetical protein